MQYKLNPAAAWARCEAAKGGKPAPRTAHGEMKWERRGEYLLEIWEQEDDKENEGEDAGWYSVATIHQPGEANAEFIAHARSDLPAALEALEAIREIAEAEIRHRHGPWKCGPQESDSCPPHRILAIIGESR